MYTSRAVNHVVAEKEEIVVFDAADQGMEAGTAKSSRGAAGAATVADTWKILIIPLSAFAA